MGNAYFSVNKCIKKHSSRWQTFPTISTDSEIYPVLDDFMEWVSMVTRFRLLFSSVWSDLIRVCMVARLGWRSLWSDTHGSVHPGSLEIPDLHLLGSSGCGSLLLSASNSLKTFEPALSDAFGFFWVILVSDIFSLWRVFSLFIKLWKFFHQFLVLHKPRTQKRQTKVSMIEAATERFCQTMDSKM